MLAVCCFGNRTEQTTDSWQGGGDGERMEILTTESTQSNQILLSPNQTLELCVIRSRSVCKSIMQELLFVCLRCMQ